MYYIIYYSIFIFSFINANIFLTSFGECTLDIYEGRVEQIPEIIELINQETIKLVEEFGDIKQRPFSVYITGNMKEFNSKSKESVPEWGIAIAKQNPDRIILKPLGNSNISFSQMKQVIIHELNHIYLFRMPQYFTIPSWFKEGMAMRSSGEFSLSHKIEISKSLWQNRILSLEQLKNIIVKKKQITLSYSQSAAAIEFLEYYYGKEILFTIIKLMKDNIDFVNAIESVTNDKLINLDKKYKNYLKNNYSWIFLFKSPKYIYVILPIILILGYLFTRYRNYKILKLWEIEENLE